MFNKKYPPHHTTRSSYYHPLVHHTTPASPPHHTTPLTPPLHYTTTHSPPLYYTTPDPPLHSPTPPPHHSPLYYISHLSTALPVGRYTTLLSTIRRSATKSQHLPLAPRPFPASVRK